MESVDDGGNVVRNARFSQTVLAAAAPLEPHIFFDDITIVYACSI